VPELALASFNVHWGRGPRRGGFVPFDIVAACDQLDADVLVLQEAWIPDEGPGTTDEVAAALGYEVVATVPMARMTLEPEVTIDARGGDPADGGIGSWSLAVLSRLPARDTTVRPLRPQLPPDPVSRALVVTEVDVDGSSLAVCGGHLPHLEFGAPLITGTLRAALPPADRPAVFAGDMNMWGWTIDLMSPPGWRRALRGGRTWPSHRPLFQIDHVLVTESVGVLRAEVVDAGDSDHLPVRAVLRFG
jgi:endonuclease/exonuclease/phosphatase family metal-dependent hydrolase